VETTHVLVLPWLAAIASRRLAHMRRRNEVEFEEKRRIIRSDVSQIACEASPGGLG